MLKSLRKFIDYIEQCFYNEYNRSHYFVKKGSQIGNCTRIFIKDFGSEPYLIKIGNHCTISSGVKFITHDGGAWVFRVENPDLNVFGKIEIKDNCFIGLNSVLLPGITIGPNAVVGAGSLVSNDVPENTVVAGVPARIISSLDDYKIKCLEKWGSMNLEGSRESWKTQIIRHFWEK